MTAMTTTEIDGIRAVITDERLLERAMLDCVAAMMRVAVLGRSVHDATIALDYWRAQFEERTKS